MRNLETALYALFIYHHEQIMIFSLFSYLLIIPLLLIFLTGYPRVLNSIITTNPNPLLNNTIPLHSKYLIIIKYL